MASHFTRTDAAADVPGRSNEHAAPTPGAARHARHAATPHGSSASVTGAFQRLDPSVTGSFAALTSDRLQPIAVPATVAGDAPLPIGVDPAVTGSFSRITPEMAARAVTRDTAARAVAVARARRSAQHGPRGTNHGTATRQVSAHSRVRTLAVVAVAAAVVLALIGVTARRTVLGIIAAADAGASDTNQAAPDGSVSIANTTYELVDLGDGTHALSARTDGGDPVVVATINGSPARLLAFNGSVIVPESYADGTWDVIAYTPGGDALAALVVDGEGAPVHGSGSVSEARVDGGDLVIVDTTGATTTVSLEA